MGRYFEKKHKYFKYPKDMKKIIGYLHTHGIVKCNNYQIEKLYGIFSEDFYCAGWVNVDKEVLKRFANWLESDEAEKYSSREEVLEARFNEDVDENRFKDGFLKFLEEREEIKNEQN